MQKYSVTGRYVTTKFPKVSIERFFNEKEKCRRKSKRPRVERKKYNICVCVSGVAEGKEIEDG